MKNSLHTLCFIFLFQLVYSQNFTWVKGPNTGGQVGTYGNMGVSAPANNPGARHGCGKWVDASGNLWCFGGEGYTTNNTLCWMNDLWKYNPTNNEWTWVRGSNAPNSTGSFGTMGVSAPSNDPPAREFMACWTDASGNFWMFGGDGVITSTLTAPEKLGDLWKYNPTNNQWTWVKGYNTGGQSGVYGTAGVSSASNVPGGRMGPGVWSDAAGNFWMFGGLGFGSGALNGFLNDLWKYNPITNQWTWITGSNVTGQFGIYGILGTPSATNAPGGRFLPGHFTDASGNLYLFGGRGFGTSAVDYLNDFWKYSPTGNTWTWIHGSGSVNVPGVYGTLGVSAASVTPGGRRGPASWKDASGNFWMFGGKGVATLNNLGELNDLFRYNPGVNEWTWMKGANVEDQTGTYGTLGITAPTNMPGARDYNTWWTSANGDFWLLGGEGFDASSTSGDNLSDLWKFNSPCNPDSILVTPGKTICSGQSVTLTAVNGGPSTTWYSSPTSTSSIATGVVLSAGNLSTTSTPTVYSYYAESNFCTAQPRAAISITVKALPTLSASTSNTLICRSNTVALSVDGANTYTWNTTPPQNGTLITVSPLNTTTYVVSGTGANGCISSISLVQNVSICQSIEEEFAKGSVYSIFPNPNTGNFTLKLSTLNKNEEVFIMNAIGQKVYTQQIQELNTNIKTELPKGIYFYQITRDTKIVAGGKLIIN
jgi:N-acetylneuraminic acid mutarotase